jgi:phage tail-like protein
MPPDPEQPLRPGEVQNNNWPLTKFHFEVKIGEEEWYFQEVSGLDTEVEVLEYRHGKSKQFSVFKMPGMKKASDVTLKKGLFTGDTKLFEWYNSNRMNKPDRKTVTISLLNELHEAEIVWTLSNAFPVKIQSTDLKAQESAIAIETLVIAHEELNINTP